MILLKGACPFAKSGCQGLVWRGQKCKHGCAPEVLIWMVNTIVRSINCLTGLLFLVYLQPSSSRISKSKAVRFVINIDSRLQINVHLHASECMTEFAQCHPNCLPHDMPSSLGQYFRFLCNLS